jgi:hypothetical protein
MNSSSPIGGYFELGLKKGGFLHDDAILLNSGRNCFEYILKSQKASKVFLPKYSCDALIEPLKKLDIPYAFYSINEGLEVVGDIRPGETEYIVYVNYFGIKDDYCEDILKTYNNQAIIDNSQAYFYQPQSNAPGHIFYSPRKFFGVPDGGCLYTDSKMDDQLEVSTSFDRFAHLIKRIDVGAEAGYEDYKNNESEFSDQPIQLMSRLTQSLLSNIDFNEVIEIRNQNFGFLHERLSQSNTLAIDANNFAAPLCYPYRTKNNNLRQKLIEDKIFVAKYWPNVLEWCEPGELEYQLTEEILPLPIDQRYNLKDMERILGIIHE